MYLINSLRFVVVKDMPAFLKLSLCSSGTPLHKTCFLSCSVNCCGGAPTPAPGHPGKRPRTMSWKLILDMNSPGDSLRPFFLLITMFPCVSQASAGNNGSKWASTASPNPAAEFGNGLLTTSHSDASSSWFWKLAWSVGPLVQLRICCAFLNLLSM